MGRIKEKREAAVKIILLTIGLVAFVANMLILFGIGWGAFSPKYNDVIFFHALLMVGGALFTMFVADSVE